MFKQQKKAIDLKSLLKNIEIPKKEESIFSIEDNGISIFDYFFRIAEDEKIEDLQIVSFRISKKDLQILEELRKIKKYEFKIKLILSDSIPTMVVGTFNYLENNTNFAVTYENTHEKMAFIKTKENHYSIFSSGNFNPDGKIEQIQIFNSFEIWELWQKELKN